MSKGWYNESHPHALASRGVKLGREKKKSNIRLSKAVQLDLGRSTEAFKKKAKIINQFILEAETIADVSGFPKNKLEFNGSSALGDIDARIDYKYDEPELIHKGGLRLEIDNLSFGLTATRVYYRKGSQANPEIEGQRVMNGAHPEEMLAMVKDIIKDKNKDQGRLKEWKK